MDFKQEITRLKRIVYFLDRTATTIINDIVTRLSELTDVTIYEPADGEVLTYSGGVWINQVPNPSTPETGFGFLGKPYSAWSGTGLSFNCYTPQYYINYVLYSSTTATKTLSAAHPTLGRIDLIAVDSTGIIVITGTPATDPVKPTVDALNQLEITEIFVAAGATTPTLITDEDVYKENTEWTGSSNNGTVDFNNTTDPFAGTKNTSCGAFTNGQYIKYTDGTTHDISDFSYLKFYVKLKATFASTAGFVITFRNNTTVVSSQFTVINGVYEFSRTDISGYQLIVIPLSEFTFTSATFNTVYFELRGSNATGFRFDNIVLQGGIVAVTNLQNALVTIQADSGAAVSDQPNDTFLFTGNGISASGKTVNFLPRLDGLIDVDIYEATNGDVLTYMAGTWYALPQTGGPGGSGTVNSGTQYRIAYYATTGTAVSEAGAITGSRILQSDANGVPTHVDTATYPTLTELSYVKGVTSAIQTQLDGKASLDQAAVWKALPTMTRTDGDTFTIPDSGNAGNWDKKLDRLTVIKWTDTTVHLAIVKSSSYSSNVVTVEIAGDTLDNTFTTTSGYYTTIPVVKWKFPVAGTLATGTDISAKLYADCAYRVLMGRANHGTAGTTNATTYDINKNGTSVFTTKLSVSSADTTGDDTSANDNTSLALDDYVTLDCDSVSTTKPVDAYIDLYLFPTNRIYL